MTIGILGGGQLGYMLALAGYPLGLHFRFLDPSPEAPVGRIAHRVTAEFSDEQALQKFAQGLEVATYEFENVPVEAASFLAERVPVFPATLALEEAQDRRREKRLFRRLGIPTTDFVEITQPADLDAAVQQVGLPAVLKTCRLGYDGKGQWLLRSSEDTDKTRAALPDVPLILEKFVPFTRELSILAKSSSTRSSKIIIAAAFCVSRSHRRRIFLPRCNGPPSKLPVKSSKPSTMPGSSASNCSK